MDWAAIKREYITTGISQRALAEKHGVGIKALNKHSRREGWVELRQQRVDKETTKVIEKASEKAADVTTKLYTRAEEALDMLGDLMKGMTELADVKIATGALKDLKAVLDAKSDADMREQEARIEKLRREAAQESETKAVTVRIEGAGDGWQN